MSPEDITNFEIDGVDSKDYPDFCDAYLSYAEHSETGEPLTEAELIQFTEDNPDFINEQAFESCI